MSLSPCPACRPSGVDWLGEIPAHREVKRLRFGLSERQWRCLRSGRF